MVGKDSSQGSEHGMTLCAHRGKIAAHTTKGGYPHCAAYGSRNLLLNLCHAQIPLRLIVGKRQGEVVQKRQHLICPSRAGSSRRFLAGFAPTDTGANTLPVPVPPVHIEPERSLRSESSRYSPADSGDRSLARSDAHSPPVAAEGDHRPVVARSLLL